MIKDIGKQIIAVCIKIIISIVVMGFLYKVFTVWGRNSNFPQDVYSDLLAMTLVILLIFFIIPCGEIKWSNYFKEESVKSKSIYVVILPIIFAVFDNLMISITRYIPKLLGGDVIGIGSNQAINILKEFTLEFTLFNCIFPAFSEEILFRFLPYVGLGITLDYLLDLRKGFENKKTNLDFIFKALEKLKVDLFLYKKTYAVVLWITITATIFALIHGPNISNFYFYFTGGLLFGWLYLKYGLISAMLGHMLSNYLSPPILHFVTYMLSDIFKVIS